LVVSVGRAKTDLDLGWQLSKGETFFQ